MDNWVIGILPIKTMQTIKIYIYQNNIFNILHDQNEVQELMHTSSHFEM